MDTPVDQNPVDRERAIAELSLLLPPTTVQFLSERVAAFKPYVMDHGSHADAIQPFPDGGLLVRGDCDAARHANRVWRMIADGHVFHTYIENNVSVSAVAGAEPRLYRLLYLRSYENKLGGKGFFSVCPGGFRVMSPLDRAVLGDLPVSVRFHTRVTKQSASEFAAVLTKWASAVSVSGVFREGPAFLRSSGLEFQGQRASFRIDVSRSGQNTVNWLTLLLLEFGFERCPISVVRYDYEDDENYAYLMGPLRGKPWTLPLAAGEKAEAANASVGAAEKVLASFVPPDAVPHPRYRSERFRVLESSYCSWDDFVLTVYFSADLTTLQQEQFSKLIKSWFTIGQYGGLGGTGVTKPYSDVRFDERTESARATANLRGAEEAVAVPLLVKILEGFSASVPIDAITIGGVGDLSQEEIDEL
jgi:hypothetical protein